MTDAMRKPINEPDIVARTMLTGINHLHEHSDNDLMNKIMKFTPFMVIIFPGLENLSPHHSIILCNVIALPS